MANMAGSDEGSGADAGRTGLDRRSLIKAGAAAGAVAWVAPQVMSVAAAATTSNTCNSYSEFFSTVVPPNPPGYTTYNAPASVAGWTVAGSVDAVATAVFAPGFSGPGAVDLAGTPGPGGISRDYSLDCAKQWTVAFKWTRNDGGSGDTTLTISGAGFTTVVFPFANGNGSAVSESVNFTTTNPVTAVTFAFFTGDTSNGNVIVGDIIIG